VANSVVSAKNKVTHQTILTLEFARAMLTWLPMVHFATEPQLASCHCRQNTQISWKIAVSLTI